MDLGRGPNARGMLGVNQIPPILWARYASYKVTRGAMPFLIAYRVDVVVPFRVTQLTPRVKASEPKKSKEGMRLTSELANKVGDDSDTKIIKH